MGTHKREARQIDVPVQLILNGTLHTYMHVCMNVCKRCPCPTNMKLQSAHMYVRTYVRMHVRDVLVHLMLSCSLLIRKAF